LCTVSGAMFEGVIRLVVRLAGVADFNVFLSESLLLDGEEMRDRDAGQGQRCGTDEITPKWMSRVGREARLNLV
jgi:hypothetical protein